MNKKFIRAKDVEDIYSIKVSTLSKQRQGNYGLPYTVVGRSRKNNRGGVILYNIDDVNEYLKNKGRLR
jgi:hypothetical protein